MTTHQTPEGGIPASLLHLLDRTLADPNRTANAKELLAAASRSVTHLAAGIGFTLLALVVAVGVVNYLPGIGQALCGGIMGAVLPWTARRRRRRRPGNQR